LANGSFAIVAVTLVTAAVLLCSSNASAQYNLKLLASFTGENGSFPDIGLIADPDGNLFGTTAHGGQSGAGTIYEYTIATGSVSALASFSYTTSRAPSSPLFSDSAGNLYGITYAENQGVGLYELAVGSHALNPAGQLAGDLNSNIYGTIHVGGAHDGGMVFQIYGPSHAVTTIAFPSINDGVPSGGLIVGQDGNLYGMSQGHLPPSIEGIGHIFSYIPATNAINDVATFNLGDEPSGGLVAGPDGDLYGITTYGGTDGLGSIFRFSMKTHSITTLASFHGNDGTDPWGSLIVDPSGNLYGTTVYGGDNGIGTVFKLDPSTGALSTLVSFNGLDGRYPTSTLLMDGYGNLFGTTQQGGTDDLGTVFEVSVPEPRSLPLLVMPIALLCRRRATI